MELVQDFYNNNAERFSDTRFCLWDVVSSFGKKFKEYDIVCDAGCGNGKNIKYFNDKCNMIGFDNCEKLVEICSAAIDGNEIWIGGKYQGVLSVDQIDFVENPVPNGFIFNLNQELDINFGKFIDSTILLRSSYGITAVLYLYLTNSSTVTPTIRYSQ